MSEQLLLFPDPVEERVERQYNRLEQRMEQMRKSQYARLGEMKRLLEENRHEIETLKAAICKQTPEGKLAL